MLLLLFATQGTGGGDTTAPILTNAVAAVTSATTALLSVDTDEGNGTLYLVVTTSATQPSIAQIKAGQNHLGAAATFASSQAVGSTGTKNFGATGLTTSATYYGHFVHTDSAANDSNRITTSSFVPAAISNTNDIDTMVRNLVRSLVFNMVR
jgi:hypothetical protein